MKATLLAAQFTSMTRLQPYDTDSSTFDTCKRLMREAHSKHGIAHCDLKTDNMCCILDDSRKSHVVPIDFGHTRATWLDTTMWLDKGRLGTLKPFDINDAIRDVDESTDWYMLDRHAQMQIAMLYDRACLIVIEHDRMHPGTEAMSFEENYEANKEHLARILEGDDSKSLRLDIKAEMSSILSNHSDRRMLQTLRRRVFRVRD